MLRISKMLNLVLSIVINGKFKSKPEIYNQSLKASNISLLGEADPPGAAYHPGYPLAQQTSYARAFGLKRPQVTWPRNPETSLRNYFGCGGLLTAAPAFLIVGDLGQLLALEQKMA